MSTSNKSTKLVLIFSLLFPAVGALGYFVYSQDQWLKVAYALSKLIQFTLPAVWIFRVLKEPFSLRKLDRKNAMLGLKTGLPLFILAVLTYFFVFEPFALLEGSGEQIRSKLQAFGAATPLGFFVMAIYISLLHSFLEEYYWRWFVYRKLRDFMSFTAATLTSSIGFTLHHIVVISQYAPTNYAYILVPLASLAVVGVGAIWAIQYEKTRSLWTVWISHLLVDLALMVVGYSLIF